jgi:DNA replication protein DnaC
LLHPKSQLKVGMTLLIKKTIADAILDRLIHQSHRIVLQGESMRKKKI